MKSAISSVRSSFIAAIQLLNYAVYDRQRKINDYPYIVIGELTEVQQGDQGEFGQIVTINVEIYNGWSSDYGDRNLSDTIVNDIMNAIITKPHTLQILGFDMPVLTLDNSMTNTEQTQTNIIHTTVLRFKLQLFENDTITYITDDNGNYLTDDLGNYLITG